MSMAICSNSVKLFFMLWTPDKSPLSPIWTAAHAVLRAYILLSYQVEASKILGASAFLLK